MQWPAERKIVRTSVKLVASLEIEQKDGDRARIDWKRFRADLMLYRADGSGGVPQKVKSVVVRRIRCGFPADGCGRASFLVI